MRYRINSPSVIQETIEGEVIIVHLSTGAYYSLDGSGAAIWGALARGEAPGEIAAAFAAPDEGAAARVLEEVRRFVDELRGEDLIVPLADGERVADPAGWAGAAFSAPTLHKYRDMEELLLLDPIHEVDEAGWPSTQKGGPA